MSWEDSSMSTTSQLEVGSTCFCALPGRRVATVGTRSAVPTTRTACSSARRGSERRTPMEGDRPT